jgi:2-polyprenyl-3-methyl-5-hydroxy-6-metoxy-1,4-benzoquinol methylase
MSPDPMSSADDQSQLQMLHRLPDAELVDRIPWLCDRARGKRVVHVGFVDAGYDEMNERHDAWLHAHLARAATSLVGIDIDPVGVDAARAERYEAYAADCRNPEELTALGLAPADVVIAGEVIEHVDDPGAFLDGLHTLLAPDGVLVLTTPNPSGLINTFALLGGYEINHPDHVIMFTWRTLTTLMGRHGWTTVETRTYVPELKTVDGTGGRERALRAGARFVLWLERSLARVGRPFAADGLIVVARQQPLPQ